MVYDFNRDSMEIMDWQRTNERMKETLADVRLGLYRKDELADFCLKAIIDAEPNENFPGTVFWAYDEPRNMPSDARCEFVYLPTYLMTLTLVNAILNYPMLYYMLGVEEIVRKALKACTGRGLQGHGYEGRSEQHYNLKLFLKSNILEFIRRYPDTSNEFSHMLDEIMKGLEWAYENGDTTGTWGEDYKPDQEELLRLYSQLKQGGGITT